MAGAAPRRTGSARPAATASARAWRSAPPRALVAESISGAVGGAPDDDPWHPERAVWPLLEVLDAAADEPWCAPLRAHRDRRHALARRMAELFGALRHPPARAAARLARRATTRASTRTWRGSPSCGGGCARGSAARIPPSGSTRRAPRCAPIPRVVALPERLSLFGPTRLAAQELAGARGAGASTATVHLWLPHPSPALWATVRAAAGCRRAPPTRRADAAAHPLLSSLGRDVRELQVRLTAAVPGLVDTHHPCPEPPAHAAGQAAARPARRPSARGHVRARARRPLRAGARLPRAAPPGRGAARGRARPARGRSHAGAARRPGHVPGRRDVRAADLGGLRAGRAPGAGAAGAAGRPGAAAGQPAARRRRPAPGAGRRPAHRRRRCSTCSPPTPCAGASASTTATSTGCASSPSAPACAGGSTPRTGGRSSWRRSARTPGRPGLDRLLLGVAMAGDEQRGWARPCPRRSSRATPSASVGWPSSSSGWRGVLAELSGERPLARVDGRAGHGRSTLLTATSGTDAWQAGQARAELAEAAHVAGPHAASVPLGLADVRSLLAERLRGRPTRAGFRTGTLTVATLVPMRSVPHRVVCLLGLDDGVFPRAGEVDGDDVLARRPLVGERDARSEDRQLLLDAIMAATEHAGRRPLRAPTSAPGCAARPRCRSGELLDAVAATAPGVDVVVRAPAAAVRRAQLRRARAVQLRPRRAGRGPRRRRAARRAAAVPARPAAPGAAPGTVALDDLVAFLEHPVKGFLTQRVGLSLYAGDEAPADALPVAPDGLATWAIGHRLLARPARGAATSTAAGRPSGAAASCRRARWATRLLADVLEDVEPLVAAAAEYRVGRGRRPGRRRGAARRHPRRRHGRRPARAHAPCASSTPGSPPKQRIRSWVRLVALTAATDEPWRAVTVGRGERFGIARAIVGPLPPDAARAVLAELVALRGGGAVRAAAAVHRHRPHLRPRPPRRGGAGRRAGRSGAGVDERARAPSAPTPPTSGSGAGPHPRRCSPASPGRRAASPPGSARSRSGCGRRCCRWRTWCADDRRSRARRVRRVRAAPHRHHGARGQRGHREDVHDRRARRPLRRRGPWRRCPS